MTLPRSIAKTHSTKSEGGIARFSYGRPTGGVRESYDSPAEGHRYVRLNQGAGPAEAECCSHHGRRPNSWARSGSRT